MTHNQARETLSKAHPKLRLKTQVEIARMVLEGEVEPEEAGLFLVARTVVKKLPEPVETFA